MLLILQAAAICSSIYSSVIEHLCKTFSPVLAIGPCAAEFTVKNFFS